MVRVRISARCQGGEHLLAARLALGELRVVRVAGVARGGASLHRAARLAHAVHDDDEPLVEGSVREHRPRVREVVRDLLGARARARVRVRVRARGYG